MAGFDPATFWTLTLRQLHLRMKAAGRRDEFAQARAAEAAWIGAHYDHAHLVKYVDALTGRDRSVPPEMVVAALNSATQNLPTFTRAEILKKKGT